MSLIERLRLQILTPYVEGCNTMERVELVNPDGPEAATQLEAMQAEIEALADKIDELDTCGMGDWEDGFSTGIRKAAELVRASLQNQDGQ